MQGPPPPETDVVGFWFGVQTQMCFGHGAGWGAGEVSGSQPEDPDQIRLNSSSRC